MKKQTDKFEGMRIYVVVPGTVQTPIKVAYTPKESSIYSFGRFDDTRDIVQPAGRQAMQVGHVRGMVEHELIMQDLVKLMAMKVRVDKTSGVAQTVPKKNLRSLLPYHAITGIVKSCRDSFELLHVKSLLKKANIRYFEFHDTQETLYEDVVTALATEPVTPFAVAGILDYLPLWGAEFPIGGKQ
jgi:hypothetical protein